MRQVFSSRRIENVEAVAHLLEEAGIQTHIQNGRGWRGAIRGNFSYSAGAQQPPAPSVWVVRSDQQAQARRLLREAGLWQPESSSTNGFIPPTMHGDGGSAKPGGGPPMARRIRFGLLALIGLALAAAWQGMQYAAKRAPPPPNAPPATAGPPATGGIAMVAPRVHQVATPPALAEMLLRDRLGAASTRAACLSIDGSDPTPTQLQALRREFPHLQAASACAAAAPKQIGLEIHGYRTDGSGVGSVELTTTDATARRSQTLQVARDGHHWRILDRDRPTPR